MKIRPSVVSVVSVVGALALGACADAPTVAAPSSAPRLQTAVAVPGEQRHLVRLTGDAPDFDRQVAALGGTVAFRHAGARIAIVAGLGDAAAQTLATGRGIAEVRPDAVVTLARPAQDAPVLELEAATAAEGGILSQANPATAIRYAWQWNMRAIGAHTAWAAGKLGSANVRVAILDTGLDYTALDLNGLVDLSRSISFVASDNAIRAANFPTRHNVDDFNGHGTNVATQVSSTGFAHAGVSSRTTLMGVKVLDASGSGSLGGILQGVLWAADHDADVINMSLGGDFAKAGGAGPLVGLINQVFAYANRAGALIVVAAGNSASDLDRNLIPDAKGNPTAVPSLYSSYCDTPLVVCVSAVGPQTFAGSPDVPAVYTNFGRSAISVAAPGGNAGGPASPWPWGPGSISWVWSMCARNYLPNPATPSARPCASGLVVTASVGTSQASPHVAGLAALLMAQLGTGNPAAIKEAIQASADDLGQSGTDPYYGKGRINVARALGL
jgi:hypothetical protein